MPIRGEAYRRFLQRVPQPAAGAELDLSPFGQGTWRIQSVIFTLATSAVAGIRAVQLSATDGTDEWWRSPVVHEIPPSTTAVLTAHPGIVGAGAIGAEVAEQVSAVFAATASGVAALNAGDSITGFSLETSAVGAAISVDVAITNVLGGTMTFRVQCPTLGTSRHVVFPDPLPAATGLVAPTVTFPGAAGTPAGSVVAYGRRASLDTVISQAWPDEGLVLEQGYHLRTVIANRDAGDQISAVAIMVEELPSGPDYGTRSAQPFITEPLNG